MSTLPMSTQKRLAVLNKTRYSQTLRQRQNDFIQKQQQENLERQNRIDETQKTNVGFFEKAGDTIGDFFGNVLSGAIKGLEGIYDFGASIVGGVGGIFSKDFQDSVKEHVAYDFTGNNITNPINEYFDASWLNDNKVGNFVENVASGVGQMLPSVAMNVLVPGSGMATMGLSATGGGTEQAFNDGAGYYQGLGHGVASGLVEMATEKLGAKMFGNTAIDDALGLKPSTKTLFKTAKTKGGRILQEMASEGLEEGVAELVNPLTKMTYKGTDALNEYKDKEFWGRVGESAAIGAATSLAFGETVGRIHRNTNNANETLAELKTLDIKEENLHASNELFEGNNQQKIDNLRAELRAELSKDVSKMSEKTRAKYIEQNNLSNILNEDGSLKTITTNSAQNVKTTSKGGKNGLASGIDNRYYSVGLRGQEQNIVNGLKSQGVKVFKGQLTQVEQDNYNRFKKAHLALSRKGLVRSNFVISEQSSKFDAYLDGNTTVFGKQVFESDEWQKKLIHEIEHFTEGSKEWYEFADFVINETNLDEANKDILSKKYGITQEDIATLGENLKNNKVTDKQKLYISEVIATQSEFLFGNEQSIERLTATKRNIAQKIYDKIKEFIKVLKAKTPNEKQFIQKLQKAENLFKKALDKAGTDYLTKQSIDTNGKLIYNDAKYARNGYAKQDISEITRISYNHHAWASNELTGVLSPEEISAFNSAISEIKNGQVFERTFNGDYIIEVGDYRGGERTTIIITDGKFNGQSIEMVVKFYTENVETTRNLKEFLYERASKTDNYTRLEKSFNAYANTNEIKSFGIYTPASGKSFDEFSRQRENGRIDIGKYKGLQNRETISDKPQFSFSKTRKGEILTGDQNNRAISKGYISNGLSSRFGNQYDNNRRGSTRQEFGKELSVDSRESEYNKERVSIHNGDRRGRVKQTKFGNGYSADNIDIKEYNLVNFKNDTSLEMFDRQLSLLENNIKSGRKVSFDLKTQLYNILQEQVNHVYSKLYEIDEAIQKTQSAYYRNQNVNVRQGFISNLGYNGVYVKNNSRTKFESVIYDINKKKENLLDYSKERAKIRLDKAIELFGETKNPSSAGWLLSDGRFVEYHRNNVFGNKSLGYQEHFEIEKVFEKKRGFDAIDSFMAEGNIRLMPEVGGIELRNKPTIEQRESLREYIDALIDGEEGITLDLRQPGTTDNTLSNYVTYDSSFSSKQIISDINAYYTNGSVPRVIDGVKYSLKENVDKLPNELKDVIIKQLNDENIKLEDLYEYEDRGRRFSSEIRGNRRGNSVLHEDKRWERHKSYIRRIKNISSEFELNQDRESIKLVEELIKKNKLYNEYDSKRIVRDEKCSDTFKIVHIDALPKQFYEIKKENAELGVVTAFYVASVGEGQRNYDGFYVPSKIKNKIFILIDEENFNFVNTNRHERTHYYQDTVPDLYSNFKEDIEKVVGKTQLDFLHNQYSKAYENEYDTSDKEKFKQKIWDEIYAQIYALNELADNEKVYDVIEKFDEKIKEHYKMSHNIKYSLSKNDDNNTNQHLLWQKLTKQDQALLYKGIDEIHHQGYWEYQLDNGDYLIDINNKVVISDGAFQKPSIEGIVEFSRNFPNKISDARDYFYEKITNGRTIQESIEFINDLYEEEVAIFYGNENSRYNSESRRQREYYFEDREIDSNREERARVSKETKYSLIKGEDTKEKSSNLYNLKANSDIAKQLGVSSVYNVTNIKDKLSRRLDKVFASTQEKKKYFKNTQTGIEITIDSKTFNKLFAKNEDYINISKNKKIAKVASLYNLSQIIKNGSIIAETEKENKKLIYLKAGIVVDEKSYNVDFEIKKQENNKFAILNLEINRKSSNNINFENVDNYDNISTQKINTILDKQQLSKEHKKLLVKEEIKDYKTKLKMEFTNAQSGIEEFGKSLGIDNIESLIQSARASRNAGISMLTDGQFNYDYSKKVGESLNDIFEPILNRGENITRDFYTYLEAYHHIDRIKNNKPTLFDEDGVPLTQEEARVLILRLNSKYEDFKYRAEKVWKYSKNLLQLQVDSGIVSEELADNLNNKYPHYIPTFHNEKSLSGIVGENGIIVKNTINTASGKNLAISDIYESLTKQTLNAVDAIRRNNLIVPLFLKSKEYQNSAEYSKIDDAEMDFEKDKTENNKLIFYYEGHRVSIKVDNNVFEGFEALYPKKVDGPIVKMAKKTISLFKKLITEYNPLFTISNMIRDIQEALFYSKHGIKKFSKTIFRAITYIKTNNIRWQQYKAMGGLSSSLFENGTAYNQESKIKKKWNKVIGKISTINSIVEQIPRFTEFILSVESDSSMEQALLDSADVTTNFSRSGKLTNILNSTLIPFLNPSVQGGSKLYRTVFGRKTGKQWSNLVLKAFVLGILPSILNNLLYDDDEEYESLNLRDKENNYILKVGDIFIKIPKGRVLTAIGGIVTRANEIADGEDIIDNIKGYLELVGSSVTPIDSLSRDLFSPLRDVASNTAWYGSEIESQKFEEYDYKDRYDETTSSIAIQIGQIINYSPKKIHYLIDQYSGVIGDILLPLTTAKAERNPISNKFTIDPVINNTYSNNFYDEIEQLTFDKNSGDIVAELKLRYLNSINSELSELYEDKREIANSDMSDNEKQKQTKVIQVLINELLNQSVNNAENIEQLLIDNQFEQKVYNLLVSNKFNSLDENAQNTALKLLKDTYFEYALSALKNEECLDKNVLFSKVFDISQLSIIVSTIKQSLKDDAISGSKKERIIALLNSMKLTATQKYMLMGYFGYKNANGERQVKTYIQSLKLTKTEKETLFKMCGY